MWICPRCGSENDNGWICPKCGYDDSKNYERHLAAFPLSDETRKTYVSSGDVLEEKIGKKQDKPILSGRSFKGWKRNLLLILAVAVLGLGLWGRGRGFGEEEGRAAVTGTDSAEEVNAREEESGNESFEREEEKRNILMRVPHEEDSSEGGGVSGEDMLFRTNIARNEFVSVVFLDTAEKAPEECWDVSEKEDGSVVAWAEEGEEGYRLYIAGEGGVTANEDSDYLFSGCTNVTSIAFNGNFDTSDTSSMNSLFRDCENLTEVDADTLDTSKAGSIRAVFMNCGKLPSIRLNSWDTSQVTDMTALFYGCAGLNELDL